MMSDKNIAENNRSMELAKLAYETSCTESQIKSPTLFESLPVNEVIKWMKIVEAVIKALEESRK